MPALGAPGDPVPIAPGTTYRQLYRPEGPWAINVVEIALSQRYLELHSVLGAGATVGRRAVSSMLAPQSWEKLTPVAGVNGDFFAMAGGAYTTIPLGLQVENGELVTLPYPGRSVFYLLADGSAHIGTFRGNAWLIGPGDLLFPLAGVNRPPERGELVLFTPRFGRETRGYDVTPQLTLTRLSGPVKPQGEVSAVIGSVEVGVSRPIPADGAVLVASGVAAYALRQLKAGDEVRLRMGLEPEVGEIRMAVGGGPRLVRDGRVSVENKVERFADWFALRRHPRTGVGLRDGAVVLATVDGRQPGYSEGMTLGEFAQLFLELGCKEAMNLDGGGSTTMVVRNRVVNSPSEGTERRVANALALFSAAAPTGKPVRLAIEPAEAVVLSGEKLPLAASGLDEFYNPVALDPGAVRWETGAMGQMSEQGEFTAAPVSVPTAGLITVRCGSMSAATVVCVVPAPARVSVTPERVTVALKATQQFVARAYDQEGRAIRLGPGQVSWSCEPGASGARVESTGLLRAPAREADLRVVARVGQVRGEAEVLVGVVTKVLADFEQPGPWSFASLPPGLSGEVAVAEDPLSKGNHCLRLSYDFSQGQETRVAQAVLNLPLPETRTISLRVLGDGQGCWLRARLRDGADRAFTVDLAQRLDWSKPWRRLTAWLPEEATPPVTLEAVYLTEYHADRGPVGVIYLDDLGAERLPGLPASPAAGKPATGTSGKPSGERTGDPSTLPAGKPVGLAFPGPAGGPPGVMRAAWREENRGPEANVRLAVSSQAGGRRPAPRPAEGHTSPTGGKAKEMHELPIYVCRRTPEPIRVDGVLDEPAWSRAASVGDFLLADGSGQPQLPTELKLCWDDANLYLAFVATDTDIWGTMRKRDDPIYEEEVVEAFLSTGGDVTRYYEFEWSPHGVVFDAKVECPEQGGRDRMKVDTVWDCEGCQSGVRVVGTLGRRDDIDQQWTVEVALPFSQIGRKGMPSERPAGRPPKDGERWRANFFRIERAGQGEFSCWSPPLVADFHVPARFGHLVFSEENLLPEVKR